MTLASKAFGDLITFTRASTKWVPNAAGVLTQVAAGVAAVAYDGLTLEKLGFSVEESRTNLVPYSQDFSNAAWVKSQCAVALGSVLAPDGSAAYKLTETNGATSPKELARSVTGFTAGTSYVLSVYAHASDVGAARNLKLAFTTGTITAGSVAATFDVAARNVTSTVNCAALITSVGNGWCRCTIIVAATVTASSSFYLTAVDTGGVASYTGDGTSGLYLWGAQLEVGSFPTSNIPTTSAQVTRAADVAVINNLAPWFNPNEGTLYVEAILGNDSPTGYPTLLELSDGTASNRLLLRRSNSGNSLAAIATAAGTSYTAADAVPFPSGQIIRAALAYDASTVAVCANGRAVASTASAPIIGINKLGIGYRASAGTEYIGGPVRAVRYFPKRLSNADLQVLTTKADPGFTMNFDFGAKTYYMGLA